MSEERSEPRFTISRSSKLGKFGLIGTAIYVFLIITILFILKHFDLIEFNKLELNEVGDFLAGVLGPLALCWLILGFFQQGQELRYSVDALKLQAEELRRSVAQQRELVDVSRQAIEFEKLTKAEKDAQELEAQIPKFSPRAKKFNRGLGQTSYSVEILNTGGNAYRVIVTINGNHGANFRAEFSSIEKGQSKSIALTAANPVIINEILTISIYYSDSRGATHHSDSVVVPTLV